MVQLNSLQLQFDNLNVVFEEAIAKDYPLDQIKTLFYQIKDLQNLIAERKAHLHGEAA